MSPWSERAMGAIKALADNPVWWTADDVAALVGQPDETHKANGRNSAVGSVIRLAASRGIIKTDGRVVKSKQPNRKGGGNRRWIGAQWWTPDA